MGAAAGLVRKYDAELFSHLFFIRLVGPQQAGKVVRIAQCNIAFARRRRFELVGIAAFGRTREVGGHAFRPRFSFVVAVGADDRTHQRQVVHVASRTGANASLVFRVGKIFVTGYFPRLDDRFVVHDDAGAARKSEPVALGVAVIGRDARFEYLRLDRHKEAELLGTPQAANVPRDENVGRAVDAFVADALFDAGGFGEVTVERLVRLVVTGRVKIEHVFLGDRGMGDE